MDRLNSKVMNEQAFTTLEYEELRLLFRRHAQTEMGRARFDALAPVNDRTALQSELDALSECAALKERGAGWSFSDLADPRESFAILRIEGATLDPFSLLEMARLCEQALFARNSILSERESCPTLWTSVENLPRSLNDVASRIKNNILPSGELDDRASPELARIRNDINRLRAQITRTLERLMNRAGESIQDEIVTVRNDRFVIPVKADHRGRVSGVTHGSSSSGATVFIEPLETIESNNHLQELKETEEREIARILFTLTEELRNELPSLQMAADAVAELDFVNAKAAFLKRFNCAVPIISRDNTLKLAEARHPLLEENLRAIEKEVVPVSFRLDQEEPVMVISGANAGGKTVVLKTAGLLSLMALSGLPVPAKEMSVPFYASVLADIGDHQSIAANLSTFTSHVANISEMIKICERPALVLLDEAGTGTDPEEGSALGVAIVDHFRRACGAHVLATTHYRGLKMYAANEEGVQNASVEFDERTLQPTYRLLVGIAGASSGIEIARRFGIPDKVINAARSQVDQSSLDATAYLQKIKREADQAESLRAALEEERAAVAEKYSALDVEALRRERQRQAAFETDLLKTIEEFEKQTRDSIAQIEDRATRAKLEKEAKARATELKRQAQESARAATIEQAKTLKDDIRIVRDGRMIDKEKENSELRTPNSELGLIRVITSREIAKGDKVRLKTFGTIGTVEKLNDDNAEILVGSMHIREKLSNLELVEVEQPQQEKGLVATLQSKQKGTEVKLRVDEEDMRSELKLIGKTTDEAVDELDRYLDEAFLNGFARVRIIHGFGTGALRRAVQSHLRNHPHVARFTAAPQDQGGEGATVVELKQ
jgi:DNA mismatch repair protein MutS2